MVNKYAYCPDCGIIASKLWVNHNNKWISVGFICKKCGYIEVWGFRDLDTPEIES